MRSLLCILVLLSCVASAVGNTALNEYGNTADYDYSRTRETIVINAEGEAQFYFPPFASQAPNVGVLLYAMLLKYADNYEDVLFPLDEPDYRIVILGPGQIRHFDFGDHWLRFESSVAFLNAEDYRETLALIQSRFDKQQDPVAKQRVELKKKEYLSLPFTSAYKGASSLHPAREKLQEGFKFVEERHENFVPLAPDSQGERQASRPPPEKEQNADEAKTVEIAEPRPSDTRTTVETNEPVRPSHAPNSETDSAEVIASPEKAAPGETAEEDALASRLKFFVAGFVAIGVIIFLTQRSGSQSTQ